MTEQDAVDAGLRPDRGGWPLGPAQVMDDAEAGPVPAAPATATPVPATPVPAAPATAAPVRVASAPPTPPTPLTPPTPAPAVPIPAYQVSPDLGLIAPSGPPRPADANAKTGQPPMRRQGRRLLAASSAAVVVVVAAVAATWLVRQGDDAAAPGPDAVQTGALDGPGPATPSVPPSSSPPATTMTVTANPSAAPTADTGRRATAGTKPATPTTRPPAAPATVRDDFAGSTLAGRWSPYQSSKDNGGVWLPSQVRVRGGELQIVGRGTDPTGKGNRSGGLCWCGAGGDQLYGVWQIRAKFDAGAGYGQGIGLWPASDDGAAEGSITLAISDSAAKDSSWHALVAPGGKSKGSSSPGNFAAWHVYAVEWRATFVRISIDGKTVFDSRQNAPGLAIPHTPQHLFMQQEIGPSGNVSAPNADTPGTVIMHVDWVTYAA